MTTLGCAARSWTCWPCCQPPGFPGPWYTQPDRQGLPRRDQQLDGLAAEVMDRALARLAGASLLTFSLDGSAVSAHRLVMRVIRENLTASNSLLAVCQAAAQLLEGLAYAQETWHQDRAATRDLVKQIMALYDSSAGCPADDTLDRRLNTLRSWAVAFLNLLGDSAAQAILIGERLVADSERVLGPDDPDTLDRATTSPSPTGPRAAPTRRSPCTSRPWPPGNGSWAPTTPTP